MQHVKAMEDYLGQDINGPEARHSRLNNSMQPGNKARYNDTQSSGQMLPAPSSTSVDQPSAAGRSQSMLTRPSQQYMNTNANLMFNRPRNIIGRGNGDYGLVPSKVFMSHNTGLLKTSKNQIEKQ